MICILIWWAIGAVNVLCMNKKNYINSLLDILVLFISGPLLILVVFGLVCIDYLDSIKVKKK